VNVAWPAILKGKGEPDHGYFLYFTPSGLVKQEKCQTALAVTFPIGYLTKARKGGERRECAFHASE
jgi:hypothetical protein